MKFSKILTHALTFIIFLLAILIIYITVASARGVFGYRLFIVKTESMTPKLKVGEMIMTKEADDLKPGDIISFYSDDPAIKNQVNTHRIVAIKDGGFITKGDSNPFVDAYFVRRETVIGKVVFYSKILGAILSFFKKPLFLFLFVILPMAVLTFFDFKSGMKSIKKAVKEE